MTPVQRAMHVKKYVGRFVHVKLYLGPAKRQNDARFQGDDFYSRRTVRIDAVIPKFAGRWDAITYLAIVTGLDDAISYAVSPRRIESLILVDDTGTGAT